VLRYNAECSFQITPSTTTKIAKDVFDSLLL
jgi:hypothetical protein